MYIFRHIKYICWAILKKYDLISISYKYVEF